MKKRILFWTENFWPRIGGVEFFCENILKVLNKNYELLVVASQHRLDLPEEDEWENIPIKRLPFGEALLKKPQILSQILRKISAIKRDFSPSLIHIHSILPSIFFDYLTKDSFPTKRFLTFHNVLPFTPDKNNYLLKYFPIVDFFSGVSNDTMKYFLELDGSCSTPSKVILNALPNLPINLKPFSERSPNILMIGHLIPSKGFDLGIKAFAKITGDKSDVKLIIAGDGIEKEQLTKMVSNLGISNKVDFLGWVPPMEIYNLMNDSQIVLVPSRCREAFCLVALQAAQMGLPVIATKMGGLPELVLNNETGILVESENVHGMATALRSLLKKPKERKNPWGKCKIYG
jgi:glycogen synthase